MSNIERMFNEFKSIFVSEDLLKENEKHANIVTAATMLNVCWFCIIAWVLTFFGIFKVGMNIMNSIVIRCLVFLALPVTICYAKKGEGKWIKHVLFIAFTILLAMADSMLKYNVTLVMILPIILSARYYNKRFTVWVAAFTTILFIISTFMSVNIGQQDINSYNLIIPEGTTITINGTLRDAITNVPVDESNRLKNIFIHFFLPKFLLFNIAAFACTQIAQSGKNMVEKQKEIAEKGKRIETELNLASAIQRSMLPSIFPPFPEHEEIDIYASMMPAKEVGGDFYDMFLVDENHLAICMADVSGKGVPASLVMMISKILIKNVTMIDAKVDKALTRVNNMLCEGNKIDMFVTCWFGILDLRSGKLEFANAGHNPPLLYSSTKGKFEYLKTKPNLVLAGMEDIKYRLNEIQMEPGDKIFLYTDGVTEATDTNEMLYGEQRLENFLNTHLSLSVEDTLKQLKQDIDSFVGEAEQFDDITMLELFYKKRKDDRVSVAQKTFKADENELPAVQEFVREELKKYDISSRTLNQIELAVEEIFVNIASYAYVGKEGDCTLTIQNDGLDKLVFTFEDYGIQFNPLEKQDPDITLSASERDIGGLGIFITKKTMDSVEYKYENGKNILTISKTIN
ncbi:MAG: SpoIIE family protein phosphatase [Clostridia bacterium]|nr:SpoIIE family protein phosphatase [Clostridia bacterium]